MKKIISAISVFALLACLLTSGGCSAEKTDFTSFAMGSVMTMSVYSSDSEKAQEIYDALNEILQDTDNCLSATKEGSEIYELNQNGTAVVSSYTIETIEKSLLLCNETNRIADITIGAVSELWGFATESPSLPDDEAINKALETVNCGLVTVDSENKRITLENGQKIDLGAFGKGAAVERMADELRAFTVPTVINFGGTVAVYGKSPKKSGWQVGVRNPGGTENEYMGIYSLTPDTVSGALYVSTSGKYEKTFTENGKTYHHILSTETGYPVETELASVTVVASGGLIADALSTILFANGLNDTALTILKNFGAGAVFIMDDGSVYRVGKYAENFSLSDSANFSLVEYDTPETL